LLVEGEIMVHSTSTPDPGTTELLQHAAHDTAELVRLELELARDELRHDIVAARSSAIFGAVSTVLFVMGLALSCAGLGITMGQIGALILGGALLAIAVVLGAVAVRTFPTSPLAATSRRLKSDERLLKEHLS
jgi:hypothetical protein